jgi:hypothetical protein
MHAAFFWSGVLDFFHLIVLAGVVLLCVTSQPSMAASPVPQGVQEQSKSRRRPVWLAYATLPFAIVLAFAVAAAANYEVNYPYSIFSPRHPAQGDSVLELKENEAPLIFVGPNWIHFSVSESGVYQVSGRVRDDTDCKLWLVGVPIEEKADTCPILIESLFPNGDFNLYASVPRGKRMRLSLAKMNVIAEDHLVLLPSGGQELDLSSSSRWALLTLRISEPGRYSVFATALEDAKPRIELIVGGGVRKNDHFSHSNELTAHLEPGDHILAVGVWWWAPGRIKVSVERAR